MKELELKYSYLKNMEIIADHKMCQFFSDPNDTNKHQIPNHIYYESSLRHQALNFSAKITEPLQLWNLKCEGWLNNKKDRLRYALYEQIQYTTIGMTIEQYENSRQDRLLPVLGYSKRAGAQEKAEYVTSLETTMNTCVLGSGYNKMYWQVLLND